SCDHRSNLRSITTSPEVGKFSDSCSRAVAFPEPISCTARSCRLGLCPTTKRDRPSCCLPDHVNENLRARLIDLFVSYRHLDPRQRPWQGVPKSLGCVALERR